MAKYVFPPNIEGNHPTFIMISSYEYSKNTPTSLINNYVLPVPTELMDVISAQYELDFDDLGDRFIHGAADRLSTIRREGGKSTGLSVNKNTMPVFQEMDHRRFSFNWQLKAKTKHDATTMLSLLRAIREDSKAHANEDADSILLKQPPLWKITLSSDLDIIKFSNEGYVLDRISVSFNEGKWIQFRDGEPVSAFLNMSFIERDRPIKVR